LLDRCDEALSSPRPIVGATVIRLEVHAHPGAKSSDVGGSHDGRLRVHVRARAVRGGATKEVLTVLARSFDVPVSHVRCVRGATSRNKSIIVERDVETLTARLRELLAH
jgi:uncharacterized protein YggU (UPF0235/DUF167 family)